MTDLSLRLLANTADLKKGLNDANKNISNFAKNQQNFNKKLSGGFKKVGGAIAAAFAAREIIRFGKEAAKLASEVAGVEQAFNRLGNADANMLSLKQATRGTVTELELMKKAIKADNFGIPMDVLARGLEFATKRAAQTGESVDYLAESFVTGLGRKSVLILDNLGISAVDLRNEIEKTGDFMSAVGAITERELGKMGEVILTDAQKMQQLQASAEQAKVKFGQLVLKGLMPFISAGTTLVNNIGETEGALLREQKAVQTAVIAVTGLKEGTDQRRIALEKLRAAYPEYFANIDTEVTSNEELLTQLGKVNEAYAERIVALRYEKELTKVNKERDKIWKQQVKDIENMKNALKTWTSLYDDSIDAMPLEELIATYKKANEEQLKYNGSTKAAYNNMARVAERAENFQNALEGIQTEEDKLVKLRAETLKQLLGINKAIQDGGGATGNEGGGGGDGGDDGDGEVIYSLTTIKGLQQEIARLKEKAEVLDFKKNNAGLVETQKKINELENKLEIIKSLGDDEEPIVFKPEIEEFDVDAWIDETMKEMESAFADVEIEFPKIQPIEITDKDIQISTKQFEKMQEDMFNPEYWKEQLKKGEISFAEYQEKLTEIQQSAEQRRQEITQQVADAAMMLTEAVSNIFEAQKNKELEAAGDNAKKREEIEKKYAKKEKALAIVQALINTALGVSKALTVTPPLGFVLAGITAALGAAQVAAIASTPLAKGGIAYGETLATVGEYPGARSNPEVIAPLNKLEGILGKKGFVGGEVIFRIEGTELVGVLTNQDIVNNSF